MGLAIAGAYPTHLDMAKRIFRQKRQRRAVTGRGETYDEGVVATEGAIRAGLASRERLMPYKLERERITEQKRQFDIAGARQEEQFGLQFEEEKRRFEEITQREEEAAATRAGAAMAGAAGTLVGMAAGSAGYLGFLGITSASVAAAGVTGGTAATLAAVGIATGGAAIVGAAAAVLLYGLFKWLF